MIGVVVMLISFELDDKRILFFLFSLLSFVAVFLVTLNVKRHQIRFFSNSQTSHVRVLV
jgi:cytochrome c biogenesis factor